MWDDVLTTLHSNVALADYSQDLITVCILATVMDHILARIKGAKLEEVKAALKADAAARAEEGIILRHVWRNADDPSEILYIFTAANLELARKHIERQHEHARSTDQNAILPHMLYLKGE